MMFPKTEDELELYITLQRIVETDIMLQEARTEADKTWATEKLNEAKRNYLIVANRLYK